MKLIASLIIIIIITILFLLSYYKIKDQNTSQSPIIKTIDNTPEIFIPSNFDFNAKMSYYFPLGISLRDNSFVTFDESNNKLLCLDEFYSSNNENKTVKLIDCTNDDQQSFSLKRFGTVPKIYNSNTDKCLTYQNFNDRLTFSECKGTLTDIQKFRIEPSDNRISNGTNYDRYLAYDNSKNAILVTNRSTTPRFQHLNFNQECSSDSCTNLTKLNNGYYLFLNTNGVLMLLQERFDNQTYSKNYNIIWSNRDKITPSEDKYIINFDENGILFIINKNNNKIWSTDKYIKTNAYKNKIIPYKLEMINNELVVTNGINEIMYTIHPHPEIIDCKLSSLSQTLCYNNNVQYRANILTSQSENGINCLDMATTLYNYKFDISETIQTLIPNSFSTQKFIYRNQSCSTPNPSFIEFGNCQNSSSYYYYYLGKSDDSSFRKRILVLCYDDKDRIIGVKSQPDVNISLINTFQNMKENFLNSTITPSFNRLVLSKPSSSNPNTLTFIVNTSVFEDSETKKAYKSNYIDMFLGYRINMFNNNSFFGPNEYPLTDFKKPNNYTSGSVNIQWTMSGRARGLAGSGIGSFDGGLRLYDKSFQLLRTFTVGRAWNNIGTFTNLTETFNITINENQFPLYTRQYVLRAGEEMWGFNSTFNFNLPFITYTLEPFSIKMY